MRIHRQYINEWKSVNDDVKALADEITLLMWKKSQTAKPMVDRYCSIPFIEGTFKVKPTNPQDKSTNLSFLSLTVDYRLYLFDSADDYNQHYTEIGNSEYKDDENKLYLRIGIVEGYYTPNIAEEVYHELNHAYQYGMGLEKKVGLYDKVAKVFSEKSQDSLWLSMAKILYYTFTHEQDSFANQFYANLNATNSRLRFEEAIIYFPNYIDFKQSKAFYKEADRRGDASIGDVLKFFGMTRELFNKRLHFGWKRFLKKLRRVYQRYQYEIGRRGLTTEGHIRKVSVEALVLNELRKRYKDICFEQGGPKW